MPVRGEAKCQGAVLVYKADKKTQTAWDDTAEIKDIYRVLRNRRADILDEITQWRRGVNEDNSFVAIYSHMFDGGMAPTERPNPSEVVTWGELREALGKVHTLWLIGCESQHAMAAWPTPKDSPVTGTMLVTSESQDWIELVAAFGHEVSLDSIVFFDQMEDHLRKLLPKHGGAIHYYDAANKSAWRKFIAPPAV